MDNVLFLAPIVKINRDPVSKSVLLNAKHIVDFFEHSNGNTVFYYRTFGDRKENVVEYEASWNLWTFEQLFEETEKNTYLALTIEKFNPTAGWGTPTVWKTFPYSQDRVNISLDYFVKAEARPSSETGSYVWIRRGDFKYVVYRIINTLAQLNTSSSNSGSLT